MFYINAVPFFIFLREKSLFLLLLIVVRNFLPISSINFKLTFSFRFLLIISTVGKIHNVEFLTGYFAYKNLQKKISVIVLLNFFRKD